MAIVEDLPAAEDGRRRLGLRSTASNEPVREITVNTADDVAAALARANAAQRSWAQVPVAECACHGPAEAARALTRWSRS